jgi:hypothetical protein
MNCGPHVYRRVALELVLAVLRDCYRSSAMRASREAHFFIKVDWITACSDSVEVCITEAVLKWLRS